MDDPYEILGVERGADGDALKKAWRRIAKETHPDLHPDDPEAAARFRRAQEAYEFLTSPDAAVSEAFSRRGRGGGAGGFGAGARAGWRQAGPDQDWLDVAEWMIVSHWRTIRQELLPRMAAARMAGPSLVARLQRDARRGLGQALEEAETSDLPAATPLAKAWLWWQLRKLELIVDPGRPMTRSPVALVRMGRSRYYKLVVYPLVYWRDGVRDEDFLRVVIQRSLDQALAGALPVLMGVSPVPYSVEEAGDDDVRWWIQQVGWPVIYGVLALLASAMILSGYMSRYQP